LMRSAIKFSKKFSSCFGFVVMGVQEFNEYNTLRPRIK